MKPDWITRGTRVRFETFKADPLGSHSLAGVQMKFNARRLARDGVVTDIRGDHPTHPTRMALWIRLDDGTVVSPVAPDSLIAILVNHEAPPDADIPSDHPTHPTQRARWIRLDDGNVICPISRDAATEITDHEPPPG